MVHNLIWFSLILALIGGVHGIFILWRHWPRFAALGGMGRFLARGSQGIYGQLSWRAGHWIGGLPLHGRPKLRKVARGMRRRGRTICQAFERSTFDALLLPILITSTIVAFWWVKLAWFNLYPADAAVPWWKMAAEGEAAALALNFAFYDVFHIAVIWLVHIWIGARLSYITGAMGAHDGRSK